MQNPMGIYDFVSVPVQCKHLHTILSKIFFLGQCEHILWRDAHRGSTPVLAVEERTFVTARNDVGAR